MMGTVEKEFEVEKGTKLLKALIDQGVDLVHTCGGNAKCTTCRVNIDVGTPTKETVVQKELFAKKVSYGLPQFMAPRMFLSCQLTIEHDMEVSPMERYNFVIHDEGYSNTFQLPGVHNLLETVHPDCDRYIGWSHEVKNSRVVYLMGGHDKYAFENESFIRLLENAIRWTGSQQE